MRRIQQVLFSIIAGLLLFVSCEELNSDTDIVSKEAIEISDAMKRVDIDAMTTTLEVNFVANTSWQATISDTKVALSWIHLSSTSGSAGDIKITISLEPNDSSSIRTAYIIISAGDNSYFIEITQKGLEIKEPDITPTISIGTTSKSVGYSSGSFALAVESNSTWVVSSSDNWVTVSPNSGDGNGLVTISYTANESTETTSSRSATVSFIAGDETQRFTLIQSGEVIPQLEDLKDDTL